jgi:3-oxoacyl-[acyl-carrier-protein] synthase II
MSIYIQGIGSVSAQVLNTAWQEPIGLSYECQEPDYTGLIAPMQLRRMSKAVRIGIASAMASLNDAGIEKPDLISIGTGYGCLADTEFFLKKLVQQEEQMLTPTAFIQSTHNTVSGQIALLLGCYGQNFTFTQQAHSFEHALQDAMMSLEENVGQKILVGGIDEMTEHSKKIIARFGKLKNKATTFFNDQEGSILGEGANMFVLSSEKKEESYAELLDVTTCMQDRVEACLEELLQRNNLLPTNIEVQLIGMNGDVNLDEIIQQHTRVLSKAVSYSFKNYCGEYPTASAFALMMACQIMKNKLSLTNGLLHTTTPNYVLISNHYKNHYYSFILLKKA